MMEREVMARCRALAEWSEEPGFTTRTFLSEPMHAVHATLRSWMEQAGMQVRVDSVGNLRGIYAGARPDAPRLYIGSHLDTVPRAGAFDGVLGVVMGVALVERIRGRRFPFSLEVVGFSEEEGVRFGIPFIGSRAFVGEPLPDPGIAEAIRGFGLDPASIGDARFAKGALGYLEFHIEQGPVLESLNLPVAVVEAIAGQSRCEVVFEGQANHAGTTPMHLRRDALAGAAEWIGVAEREARATPGLVATVGRIELQPGASNAVPGLVRMSLDLRHSEDAVRHTAVNRLLGCAREIAARRGLCLQSEPRLDQPAVRMNAALTGRLERAVEASGYSLHRMTSGAGHDAMIVAGAMPAAMLFLRTPGGISHQPEETVWEEDVRAGLAVGLQFLEELEASLA